MLHVILDIESKGLAEILYAYGSVYAYCTDAWGLSHAKAESVAAYFDDFT